MIQGVHNAQRISTATTTVIPTNSLSYININNTLAGTVTVNQLVGTNVTTLAVYAAGTTPQSFHWHTSVNESLQIITASADDITVIL